MSALEKLRSLKIDWLNHLISFFSALLGIYIAFRLENYRESQQALEKAKVIERTIKAEIQSNIEIYRENVEKLSSWLEYHDFYNSRRNSEGQITLGKIELTKLQEKYPTRFNHLDVVKILNDTLTLYDLSPVVDVIPATGISTSSWRASMTSGLLSSLDYKLVHDLSKIYDWTEKDIGPSDKDFYENMLGVGNRRFTNMEKLVNDYSIIVKTYELKLKEIRRIHAQIKWSDDKL